MAVTKAIYISFGHKKHTPHITSHKKEKTSISPTSPLVEFTSHTLATAIIREHADKKLSAQNTH